MANKMISEKELQDDFLSAMIRSEEPIEVPEGFSDEVMDRIGLISQTSALKPYSPPFWLKWGIPGVIVMGLIGLVISGQAYEPIDTKHITSIFQQISGSVSSIFSELKIDIQFRSLNISPTVLWILLGGVVLTWSFLLLNRFLQKKVKL